jgi:hypothetical protein
MIRKHTLSERMGWRIIERTRQQLDPAGSTGVAPVSISPVNRCPFPVRGIHDGVRRMPKSPTRCSQASPSRLAMAGLIARHEPRPCPAHPHPCGGSYARRVGDRLRGGWGSRGRTPAIRDDWGPATLGIPSWWHGLDPRPADWCLDDLDWTPSPTSRCRRSYILNRLWRLAVSGRHLGWRLCLRPPLSNGDRLRRLSGRSGAAGVSVSPVREYREGIARSVQQIASPSSTATFCRSHRPIARDTQITDADWDQKRTIADPIRLPAPKQQRRVGRGRGGPPCLRHR